MNEILNKKIFTYIRQAEKNMKSKHDLVNPITTWIGGARENVSSNVNAYVVE